MATRPTKPKMTAEQLEALNQQFDIPATYLPAVVDTSFEGDDNDLEKTDEDMLNDVLSELGGTADAKVLVYKIIVGKPQAYVGSFEPANFSIDAIKATYGAGEFSIVVRSGGRIRTRRIVSIAEPIISPNNAPLNVGEIVTAAIEKTSNNFLETLKTFLPAQPAPKSTMEILQELQVMKEVFAPAQPIGNNTNSIKDFLELRALFKEMDGESREPSTSDMIMQGLQTIAPVLANAAVNKNNVPPAVFVPQTAQQNAPVNAPVVAPETVNNIESEAPAMSLQETMMFNLLLANAERDNDPLPYAQMLIDLVGVDYAKNFVNSPTWWQDLVNREQRVQSFEQWFNDLRLDIIDAIAARESENVDDSQSLTTSVESDNNSETVKVITENATNKPA